MNSGHPGWDHPSLWVQMIWRLMNPAVYPCVWWDARFLELHSYVHFRIIVAERSGNEEGQRHGLVVLVHEGLGRSVVVVGVS